MSKGFGGFELPHFERLRQRVLLAQREVPEDVVSEMDAETSLIARMGERAPRVPWDVFYTKFFEWHPGEHVTMIGPTGQGKTTAMLGILPKRKYRAVLGTKPADDTLDDLVKRKGYVLMDRWRAMDPEDFPHRILWPNARDLDAVDTQKSIFKDGLSRMFREGGWCVGADELGYLTDMLGLRKEIKLFLIQGRSLGISFISATQRPSWVPLEVYSQATHLFMWRTTLPEDVQRLSNLNGTVDPKEIASYLARLEKFQFLYVNMRTGVMCRTRAPKIEDVI